MKKVIIVGGGFGGLNCAKSLARVADLEIIVFDRHNYHLFQPLLYQVATGGLASSQIAMPIRSVFAKKSNIRVILSEVKTIDLKSKFILADDVIYPFDYLVVAAGASHSYFGHWRWEEFAPGLKTLEQAVEIRRRILRAFEEAEKTTDAHLKSELLTFVIVGGGPTGVELAGAIAEIARDTLRKDFRQVKPRQTRIVLLEAGPRILPSFSTDLSKRAEMDLRGMGIELQTNARVTGVSKIGVSLGADTIKSRTVLWAAGVQPSPLALQLCSDLDPKGRVYVKSDLSLPENPHVFAIGDMVHFSDHRGAPLPGLAPVAIQQGRHVARNIVHDLLGEPRDDFRYLDKGQIATIGRRKAVLQYKRLRLGGGFAWLTWIIVHIFYLIGFKNRLTVFLEWAWAYFTHKRGSRLIVEQNWRLPQKSAEQKS